MEVLKDAAELMWQKLGIFKDMYVYGCSHTNYKITTQDKEIGEDNNYKVLVLYLVTWSIQNYTDSTKRSHTSLINTTGAKGVWKGMSREYKDMSREYKDMSREYKDMNREYKDMSREYKDMSREYKDMNREYTGMIVTIHS